jgi:hypothetical protein
MELLNYFNHNNITISPECRALFDIASAFYYNYYIKDMPTFIDCARYFVFFDRLIVHCTEGLEKLYPGFKKEIDKEGLGYLEKLDIIKNFISSKLFISINLGSLPKE